MVMQGGCKALQLLMFSAIKDGPETVLATLPGPNRNDAIGSQASIVEDAQGKLGRQRCSWHEPERRAPWDGKADGPTAYEKFAPVKVFQTEELSPRNMASR